MPRGDVLVMPWCSQVIGDVVCDKVMVLEQGRVFGDISASSLTLGPEVSEAA